MAGNLEEIFELAVQIFVLLILGWVFIQIFAELLPLVLETGLIDPVDIVKWIFVFIAAFVIAIILDRYIPD